MKRFIWIGLIITSVALMAAQCGASRVATEASQVKEATIDKEITTQNVDPEDSDSQDREPTKTPTHEPTATPDSTPTPEPEEQVVESVAKTDDSSEHPANCEDPFAGISINLSSIIRKKKDDTFGIGDKI